MPGRVKVGLAEPEVDRVRAGSLKNPADSGYLDSLHALCKPFLHFFTTVPLLNIRMTDF
jgi:hypothetical protein